MKNILKTDYFKSLKWGFSSIIINFFKQIILVPIFISCVGKDFYSFWLIISAIVFMIRAINLGQLNYSSNVINLSYHIKSDIKEELAVSQGANLMMLFLQFFVGLVISSQFILGHITNYESAFLTNVNAQLCVVFLVVSTILYQYSTLYLLRLFEPLGKINLTIKYQTIGEFFDFVVTALSIYFTRSILLTCFAVFIFNILYSVSIFYFIKKRVPFEIPLFRNLDLKKSFEQIRKSFLLCISFLIEKIYEIGINLVVVRVFSSALLPVFTTSRVLSNSSLKVSNTMTIPIMPSIQKQFALEEKHLILQKISLFWRISGTLLMSCMTVAIPFIPYLYKLWTVNQIEFNMKLLFFLLIAILFQNHAMILTEFLKKTNLSRQILVYNLIKVPTTVIFILISGIYNKGIHFVGIGLLAGELTGLTYLLIIMSILFNGFKPWKEIIKNLLPILLFTITFTIYLFASNYLIFLISNILILLMNNFMFLKKNLLK